MTPQRTLLAFSAGFALAATLIGCKTDKPVGAEDSLAWFHATNCPTPAIKKTCNEVFTEVGFKLVRSTATEFVFERSAGATGYILYGDWDKGVTERAIVKVAPETRESVLVTCQAWSVRDAGDRIFEQTQKTWRSGKYEKLMQEVSRRLTAPSVQTKPAPTQ